MKIHDIRNNGFILPLACSLFDALRQVSLFQQVRNISKGLWNLRHRKTLQHLSPEQQKCYYDEHRPLTHTYLFPELWVTGSVIAAVSIYCLMVAQILPNWLGWICVIIACLRMFEILVYHINVMLFDPILNAQNNYAIKSATRMLILLMINMIEYILYFSIVYLFFMPHNLDISGWQVFSMSISTFMNIEMPPLDVPPSAVMLVVRLESILGVFMNMICIARVLGMLPRVRTKDSN